MLTHLQRLEAESIQIMREVVAECEHPVMLYSVGKDSAVMLHLAVKAFYPSKPPFPLLHVDTTWKFKEMIEFRDVMVKKLGLDLIVHINPYGVEKGINPFTHGSAVHTDIWKTEGLKQALDKLVLMSHLEAHAGMRKSRVPRSVFFQSVRHNTDGIPSCSALNSGGYITRAKIKVKVFEYFRFQTGLSSTSGSTST